MTSVVLHHAWDAVCPIKVRMCLLEKGVAFQSVVYEISRLDHLNPDYLAINPQGVLPAFVHGGHVILESSFINEYIDEAFPGPSLMPSDAALRAHVRAWVKFQDDVLHPATRPHTFSLMLLDPRSKFMAASEGEIEARLAHHPDPSRAAMFRKMGRTPATKLVLDEAETVVSRAFDRLEAGLKDGRNWLAGDTVTLADIAMAGVIDRLEHCALSRLWGDRLRTAAWVDRLQSRAAYRKAIPSKDQRLPGPLN